MGPYLPLWAPCGPLHPLWPSIAYTEIFNKLFGVHALAVIVLRTFSEVHGNRAQTLGQKTWATLEGTKSVIQLIIGPLGMIGMMP